MLGTLTQLKQQACGEDRNRTLHDSVKYTLHNNLNAFETVLKSEFGIQPLYLVTSKRGYDTGILIENGALVFPPELLLKVPAAVPDLDEGTRCLAFELCTASGFHFHRANESVLHRYYGVVMKGDDPPKTRNIGDYIKLMEDKGVGDKKVLMSLRDLKDYYRNPLIHPEHTIANIDDAIALMNAIHSAITCMLKEIKETPTSPSSDPVQGDPVS